MGHKKIITIVCFALVAVILYWIRAEFDISLSKYAAVNAKEDIDFNWGTCILWAAVGGAIGAVPVGSQKSKKK